MYQPVPGVDAEAVAALRTGSWRMTPEGGRDDVVIVYVHGGGFRSGLAAEVRGLGAQLALAAQTRVLLPECRLAPEAPFPAGLEDRLAAFDHATTMAPKDVVAGESAVANLALAVLLRRAREQHPSILAGVLYSGVFDLRLERFSNGTGTDRAATDLLLPEGLGRLMHDDYFAGHADDAPWPALS